MYFSASSSGSSRISPTSQCLDRWGIHHDLPASYFGIKEKGKIPPPNDGGNGLRSDLDLGEAFLIDNNVIEEGDHADRDRAC